MIAESVDPRRERIAAWLHAMNFNIHSFEPASSDASFRRYFRIVHEKGRHIVMDAPPDKENTEPFIKVAKILKDSAIHVPEIFQLNLSEGFLLLEDFGTRCLLDELTLDNVNAYYQQAFDCLFDMQSKTSDDHLTLPEYNADLLIRELDIFYQWFAHSCLRISVPESIKDPLNDLLVASALAQPRVCVHRDFHSRNLMVLQDNSLGVIDFQDAVIGPITYDLVSLLKDCYIDWPQDKIAQLTRQYYNRISQAELVTCDYAQFTRWFDLMGLQRHLKAIGIFSRLSLRDQKHGYLDDIPRTLHYVESVLLRYPELADFSVFFQQHILPEYHTPI